MITRWLAPPQDESFPGNGPDPLAHPDPAATLVFGKEQTDGDVVEELLEEEVVDEAAEKDLWRYYDCAPVAEEEDGF